MIEPAWPIDASVGALSTTREDGVGPDPKGWLDPDQSSGDDPGTVSGDRERPAAALPARPHWLRQVHGSRVIHLADWRPDIEADAAWTDRPGEVVAIQTADCLPILLADRAATVVAGIHGGWRSLAGGIIGNTLAALPVTGSNLCAWIGPAICGRCYQVGEDVRAAFRRIDPALEAAFEPDGDRWCADLKWIAAHQMRAAGVEVFDSGRCTFEEPETFYSYRRDGRTGRMVTVVWLKS